MPARGTKPKAKEELILNDNLKPVFIDGLAAYGRKDGIHFLRFFSRVPEGMVEQARMIVQISHLKKMITVLCEHCDYYPKKPGEKTSDGEQAAD